MSSNILEKAVREATLLFTWIGSDMSSNILEEAVREATLFYT
jgi:hypothetical protein